MINIKPIITAFDATTKAEGTFKGKVLEVFNGCKTADQFRSRRAEFNAAIDKAVSDKDKAKRIKAKANTVLNRDILAPANIKLAERKGGRKAKGTDKAAATPAKASKATVQPTLQAATVADVLSILPGLLAGKSKADAIAVRDRIVASLTTIIATLK
jgi:hypothetical protein